MATLKITLYCCLCSAKHEPTIELPAGWDHRYGGIDIEDDGFCPNHQKVAEFAAAQCPGCVGGWGDCDMWRAFADSRSRDITRDDLTAIRSGICPRRTNGTMLFSRSTGIQSINLADRASKQSGAAFADAIEAYCKAWPAKETV